MASSLTRCGTLEHLPPNFAVTVAVAQDAIARRRRCFRRRIYRREYTLIVIRSHKARISISGLSTYARLATSWIVC